MGWGEMKRTDDPPPLVVGRVGREIASSSGDALDRLRSLSEAAEERAVEEFKERLRSDEAVERAAEALRVDWSSLENWERHDSRDAFREALSEAIEAAEKGAS